MRSSRRMSHNLYQRAYACLMCTDPAEKCRLTLALHAHANGGALLSLDKTVQAVETVDVPGRPAAPALIDARQVPRRALGTEEGRVALLHALAHIEFNAINLALDAVYRFRDVPRQFQLDWLRVAKEEAQHFTMVSERLLELNSWYGALPAHNGLWDMARRTAHDVMVRMALVPRVLEARGLDVAPGMMARLRQVGDSASAEVLDVIYREEVGHVKIGNHWFVEFATQRGLDPQETFIALLREYTHGQLRGPFNHQARFRAGFSQAEMAALEALDGH
ncbi:ferritin-like domain-containing protein [Granulosicoccaceae sp. 1_MG-2023]|nr:ferritin-like domain-containing protein [Granulosicoccaceae sp. 1_MG-2023]